MTPDDVWRQYIRDLTQSEVWLRDRAREHQSPTLLAKAEGLAIARDMADEALRISAST